jgi:hypothetical protein
MPLSAAYGGTMKDLLTAADRLAPHDDKVERAKRYLRERNKYCLDLKVQKLPKKHRPPTVLDRWLESRPA